MSQEVLPLISKYDGDADRKSRALRASAIPRDEELRLYSRWQSFCSVCMFVSIAGTTYAFAIFSALLQDNLGYSTSTCDLIASIGTTGLYLSLPVGLMIEKVGFKTVIYTGGMFIFVGFLYIFFAVKSILPSNFYSVSFFYFLSQAGVSCHITSAVTVSVKLFPPESRGVAIGLSKGYFGLSTAVLSNIAGGYFDSIPAYFLLFIAAFIPLVGMTGATFSNVLPAHLVSFDYERANGISTSLDNYIIHWFVLFFVLLVLGYVQYAYDLSDWLITVLVILLLGVVFSIQMLPDNHGERLLSIEDSLPSTEYDANKVRRESFSTFRARRNKKRREKIASIQKNKQRPIPAYKNAQPGYISDSGSEIWNDEDSDASYSDADSLLGPVSPSPNSPVSPSDNAAEKESLVDIDFDDGCYYGDSLSLPESIKTWRLWGLFFSFLVTCGSGLMVIYNVYSIAESVGKSPSTFFVTLISLANGLGRVVAGLTSDHLLEVVSISKLQLLCLIVLLMSFTQALLSIGTSSLLFPCLLGVGFLFGCNVSVTAINVADIYGEKYIATNFGFIDTSPIIGSYIFATFSIDLFYTENTVTDDGEDTCIGASCFRYCFILNSLATLIASLLIYYMHTKTAR